MGIQPSRSKTRIRTKRSQPVPTTDDLVGGGPLSPQTLLQRSWDAAGVCCVPVTIGHFKEQALVAVYHRHLGRTCAPQVVSVPVRDWRAGRA